MLFSALLLAGCTEEFATLHFGDSINKTFVAEGYASKISYREFLLGELAKRGVSVDQLDIETDEKNSKVLNLSFKSRFFDQDQKKRVRDYLDQQLADRKAASFSATLHAYPERVKPRDDRHALETLKRSTTQTRVEPRGAPSTQVTYLRRGLSSVKVQGEMQCHFESLLSEPLPFEALRLLSSEADKAEAQSNTNVWVRYRYYSEDIPALLVFDDANLARLIDKGEIDIDIEKKLAGKISTFSFAIDGLSSGTHTNGRAEPDIYYDLHRQCNELIGALGRPFSFHMGGGMDRLISVTYKKPD